MPLPFLSMILHIAKRFLRPISSTGRAKNRPERTEARSAAERDNDLDANRDPSIHAITDSHLKTQRQAASAQYGRSGRAAARMGQERVRSQR